MERKQRSCLWDNIKFILILLMVLGHFADLYTEKPYLTESTQTIYFIIYGFHMPAFIFINGLFAKNTIRQRKWHKLFDYFVLYVAVKAVWMISSRINGGGRNFWLPDGGGIAWYALALGAFVLITMLLQHCSPVYVLCFSIVVGCLSGYHSADGDILALNRILAFYPFFYLGYLCDREKIRLLLSGWKAKVIAAAIAAVYLVYCITNIEEIYWLRPLLTGRNSYDLLEFYPEWGGIFRLIHYIVIGVLLCALIALVPNRRCIITKWGERATNVYVLHYLVIQWFQDSWGGEEFITAHCPEHPELVLIPVSIAVTIFFSLGFWERPMKALLHPKWDQAQEVRRQSH